MAKDISKMTSDRLLRQEIHHAKDADTARAAMARLVEITPEKNRGGLKGIRDAASRKIEKLEGASGQAPSSGGGGSSNRGNQPSGQSKPSGKAGWNEGKLRRAMRNEGDEEAHAILKSRGRVNGSDERAYKEAVDKKKQAAAGSSSAKPKISTWEARRLKKNAARGDRQSYEKLKETGQLTSDVEQQYQNIHSGRGGWTDRVPSSRPSGSWEERLVGDVVKNAPAAKRGHMEERARVTIDDLKGKGHSQDIIEGVVGQYADEAGLRQAHREAEKLRAKLKAEEEKGKEGRGR